MKKRILHVIIKGWASDRNAMFATAKIWLVPSVWEEPFGRVSMEAQAANRAVLVADIGGLPETISDFSYIQKGYNMIDWLDKIRKLLNLDKNVLIKNKNITISRFSKKSYNDAILMLLKKTS